MNRALQPTTKHTEALSVDDLICKQEWWHHNVTHCKMRQQLNRLHDYRPCKIKCYHSSSNAAKYEQHNTHITMESPLPPLSRMKPQK